MKGNRCKQGKNTLNNIRQDMRVAQCIRMLTEEDLLFLRENVKEGIIDGDGDYVDDFRGLGLMYEVEGGFSYSPRAFKLLGHALDYEGKVNIPEKFPERNVLIAETDDIDFEAMFN